MKRKLIFLFILLSLLASCAPPTPEPVMDDLPFDDPADIFEAPEIYIFPTPMPTEAPVLMEGTNFLAEFSDRQEDWPVLPGTVTAAQVNVEVARQEGNQISRVEQKVINGFVRIAVLQEDGQVFEILSPAEVVNGKLKELKLKSVGQVPVLSSHGALLEDYFEVNFPELVQRWKSQGATDADLKYAAVITVTWATKYGPLRISYKVSGKYISEAGKYPGQIDFLRSCMYEQARAHFLENNRRDKNWYPVPIVGLSGTTLKGESGKMKSDALGWIPMLDFAKAESETLNEIGETVNGVMIESKGILAELQAAFDRAFMPLHCTEATYK